MARQPRIEIPGIFHHVTGRGASDALIFPDGNARHLFLHLVGETATELDWDLAAYCALGSHFHLLVRPPQATLGAGMQRTNSRFAQWFNRRHARRGRVWGDRFHSRPIEPARHLAEAVLYIELNAVDAGLVVRPEEWEWSSFAATAGYVSPWPWHRAALARAAVGATGSDAELLYRDRVERELEKRRRELGSVRKPGSAPCGDRPRVA